MRLGWHVASSAHGRTALRPSLGDAGIVSAGGERPGVKIEHAHCLSRVARRRSSFVWGGCGRQFGTNTTSYVVVVSLAQAHVPTLIAKLSNSVSILSDGAGSCGVCESMQTPILVCPKHSSHRAPHLSSYRSGLVLPGIAADGHTQVCRHGWGFNSTCRRLGEPPPNDCQ